MPHLLLGVYILSGIHTLSDLPGELSEAMGVPTILSRVKDKNITPLIAPEDGAFLTLDGQTLHNGTYLPYPLDEAIARHVQDFYNYEDVCQVQIDAVRRVYQAEVQGLSEVLDARCKFQRGVSILNNINNDTISTDMAGIMVGAAMFIFAAIGYAVGAK